MEYRRINGELVKKTTVEWAIYDLANMTLAEKITYACDLLETNYSTYCEQGISFTYSGTEYIIKNNSTTRDEIDKKLTNIILDIDDEYNWTMDNPRFNLICSSKAECIAFMESVQSIIADNETKLRNKKTEIKNYTETEVDAFISTPVNPTYERVI